MTEFFVACLAGFGFGAIALSYDLPDEDVVGIAVVNFIIALLCMS